MMSISGKALCKIVERHGWVLKRVTGSHYIYAKENISIILSIPVHGNRDLPIGYVKKFTKRCWSDGRKFGLNSF